MDPRTVIALSCNVIVAICIIGAIALLFAGKDGWGWLLLLAVIIGQDPASD